MCTECQGEPNVSILNSHPVLQVCQGHFMAWYTVLLWPKTLNQLLGWAFWLLEITVVVFASLVPAWLPSQWNATTLLCPTTCLLVSIPYRCGLDSIPEEWVFKMNRAEELLGYIETVVPLWCHASTSTGLSVILLSICTEIEDGSIVSVLYQCSQNSELVQVAMISIQPFLTYLLHVSVNTW